MITLQYSREMQEVVEVRDTMSAEEAINLLARELLGNDYYIVDSVGPKQANAIIVRDILRQYASKKKKRRW